MSSSSPIQMPRKRRRLRKKKDAPVPIDDINDLNVIVLEDIDDIVDDIQESPVKGNELSGYGKTRNLPLPKIKGSESAPKKATSNPDLLGVQGLAGTELWTEKYKPISPTELHVHKKKVDQVRSWLKQAFANSRSYRILLLKGPAGCGKTATMTALAQEMDFEIIEWLDLSQNYSLLEEDKNYQASISSQFSDFLSLAGKHSGLDFAGDSQMASTGSIPLKKQVLLIKDVPNLSNISLKKAIHAAIQRAALSRSSKSPIVFILSDVSSTPSWDELSKENNQSAGSLTVHNLIPPQVLHSPVFACIAFNPVAQTLLVKALTRIVELEFRSPSKKKWKPTKATIESIAKASGGDIRSAITNLQFFGRDGVAGSKRKNTAEDASSWSGRNISTNLFRVLGKILYNKRVDEPSLTMSELPKHLQWAHRPKLEMEPEEIFKSAQVDSDTISLFLEQNYLDFFSDVDDVTKAAEYMSLSDQKSRFSHQSSALDAIPALVFSRGLLFSSASEPPKSSGLRKLYKPQFWKCLSDKREFETIAASLVLEDPRHSTDTLLQFMIPFEKHFYERDHMDYSAPRKKLIWKLNSFQTRGRTSNGHGNGESVAVDDDEIEAEIRGRPEDLYFKTFPSTLVNEALMDLTWLDDDDIVD